MAGWLAPVEGVRRFIRTDALKPWAEQAGGARGRSLRPLGVANGACAADRKRPAHVGQEFSPLFGFRPRPSAWPGIRPRHSTAISNGRSLRRKCESPDQGTTLLARCRIVSVSPCSTPPAIHHCTTISQWSLHQTDLDFPRPLRARAAYDEPPDRALGRQRFLSQGGPRIKGPSNGPDGPDL